MTHRTHEPAPRPPAPSLPQVAVSSRRFLARHGRFTTGLGIVLGLLVVVNVVRAAGPTGAGLILGPIAAAVLVLLARRWGLTWADLGLCRRTWRRGAAVAAAAVVAVGVVYAIGAALPATREAFFDVRYQLPPGRALLTALVVIPIGTVLVEEIAFRGVLQGFVTRHRGVRWGLGLSSVLFGAWHILPSLGLTRVNPALSGLTGHGPVAQVIVVAGAVVFTAVAGYLLAELRRRSGSLLASSGLHWAVNGLCVIVAAVIHAT